MLYKKQKICTALLGTMLLAAGCSQKVAPVAPTDNPRSMNNLKSPAEQVPPAQETQTVAFSSFNAAFKFQARIPSEWKIEYIPEIESINIYNPKAPGATARQQSQIFIRYFNASAFLTLSTVDILKREETEIRGHAAVKYEIKKKPNIVNFPSQPDWRNTQHKLIDVRLSKQNPSTFYVFAYNPELPTPLFDDFINSVVFHNDTQSFSPPIDRALERITKKPFGINVSPDNSPVNPERFSGYHNAADFEILPGEESTDVAIHALCGGKLLQKKSTSGYGGVAVQECLLDNQPITVIYGHLKLSSIIPSVGTYLAPGDFLGVLGNGFSPDTDGERKHLHLGIHKGTAVDIRGYVAREQDLAAWINPQSLLGN